LISASTHERGADSAPLAGEGVAEAVLLERGVVAFRVGDDGVEKLLPFKYRSASVAWGDARA
jgi:hypothetical protein